MRESKECVECGGIYFRAKWASNRDWEERKYCSAACNLKVQRAKVQRAKEAVLSATNFGGVDLGELKAAYATDEEGEISAGLTGGMAAGEIKNEEGEEARGIERELKVVRAGPNPRMLVCEYYELASRRTCLVKVRDNRKFMRGMTFRMREPREELEYKKPWEYRGVMPRRRGRW